MSLSLILNVSQDPALLESRSLILRAAGYVVEPALSLNHAVNQFRAGDFDLILLCHSIPMKDQDRLICLIRASGSLVPVVSIASPVEQRGTFADTTVGNDLKQLLKGIEEVLVRIAKKSDRGGTASSDGCADTRPVETGLGRKTVLCVDDEPALLAMRRSLLESAGYSVLTVLNGSDGLKVFATGIADAVILDYAMPFMNGGVVAAQMRQIKSDIPLILYSGFSSIPEEDVNLFDQFIPKGVSPNTLLSALKEVCLRRKGNPPMRSHQTRGANRISRTAG